MNFLKRLSKHFLLFIILLFFSSFIHANLIRTDANIFGHVVNAKTGEHIPFINVVLKNTTIGVSTDATGHYSLTNLPEEGL